MRTGPGHRCRQGLLDARLVDRRLPVVTGGPAETITNTAMAVTASARLVMSRTYGATVGGAHRRRLAIGWSGLLASPGCQPLSGVAETLLPRNVRGRPSPQEVSGLHAALRTDGHPRPRGR